MKLEHMREQIASGELVIRQMSLRELAKYAAQRAKIDAISTPAERARRAAGLENRRKRTARLA
jgi:hypothetical protein